MKHPGWIELDAQHLGARDEAVAAHVGGCEDCRRYLARLAEPLEVPGWLASAPARPRPRESRAWWLASAAAVALAVVGAAVLARSEPEVRVKGPPAIVVHARRGDVVAPWDGAAPFAAGDAIRFEVQASGRSQVVVAAPSGGAPALSRLYSGTLADGAGAGLLPLSFTFDAAPGPQAAYVVLSRTELSDADLGLAVQTQRRDADVWVVVYSFPKREVP